MGSQSGESLCSFANASNCIDNDVVKQPPWRERIERAEELASTHEFAREVLRLYAKIANFQQDLYQWIEVRSTKLTIAAAPVEVSDLLTCFQEFLRLLAGYAPDPLRSFATSQLDDDASSHRDLLNTFWIGGAGLNDLEEFCARAFLQPCAEFVRSNSQSSWHEYNQRPCTVCGRKPAF